MSDQQKTSPPKREYPPLYEKLVPIALVVIVALIVILLLIIVGVALGVIG